MNRKPEAADLVKVFKKLTDQIHNLRQNYESDRREWGSR